MAKPTREKPLVLEKGNGWDVCVYYLNCPLGNMVIRFTSADGDSSVALEAEGVAALRKHLNEEVPRG